MQWRKNLRRAVRVASVARVVLGDTRTCHARKVLSLLHQQNVLDPASGSKHVVRILHKLVEFVFFERSN
jgi:hypothetical protein